MSVRSLCIGFLVSAALSSQAAQAQAAKPMQVTLAGETAGAEPKAFLPSGAVSKCLSVMRLN